MRAQGQTGVLRVGYQRAALLGAWSAELSKSGCTLHAKVRSVDQYWITQTPVTLDVHVGQSVWRWEGVQLTVANGSVSVNMAASPQIIKEGV